MTLPFIKSMCEMDIKAQKAIDTLLRKLDTSLDYYLNNMIRCTKVLIDTQTMLIFDEQIFLIDLIIDG